MKSMESAKPGRRPGAVRLGVAAGLAVLFLAVLLWGLPGVTPAHADPGPLYVDGATGNDTLDCTNPITPCETIGYALSQAASGDEIRVAEGTYTETLDIAITVTLRGGYEAAGWTRDIAAHPTIVDANGADDSVFDVTPGLSVTVEGFTIQGANHTSDSGGGFNINDAAVVISDTVIRENSTSGSGGGVFAEGNSTLSLINSTVTANTASGAGGMIAGGGRVLVRDTIFAENSGWHTADINSQTFEMVGGQVFSNTVSGGVAISLGSSGTISGTHVLSNTSTGILVSANGNVSAQNLTLRGNAEGVVNQGILTITNSIFENNSGGGVVSSENFSETNRLVMDGCIIQGNVTSSTVSINSGNARIRNTRIVSNVASGTAGSAILFVGEAGFTPTVELVNVLLAGNRSQGQSIVYNVTGSAMLMNVTVADNSVNSDWPIVLSNEVVTLTNTVVWGNTTNGEDILRATGVLSVSHSDVQGGWPGDGNISADPLFADATNGDYHLQSGSPAVNAGTPYDAPPDDLDGAPRDALPDMGAYEFPSFDWDLAVVDVQPGQAVLQGSTVPLRFTLYNFGKENLASCSYRTRCVIEHDDNQVFGHTLECGPGMPPLTSRTTHMWSLRFDDPGMYTETCTATLKTVGDQRPANNVLTQTFTVEPQFADAWVRDNPDDDGSVPSSDDDWYESPDLWVRNNNDGGTVHQDPIAGVNNYVYVRLRNRGTTPVSYGTVRLYWIEPSLGVRCGDWAWVGDVSFGYLRPGEVRTYSRRWTPTRGGHTCLQAVIDSGQDRYNRKLECDPQWAPWDNNVGWHNVNIIENAGGGLRGLLDVQQAEVQLVNVYNLPQDVDVIIERMTFPTTGTITVQLPSGLFDRWLGYGARWGEGIEVLTATKEISVTGAISATIGAIPMQAAEKAKVGLRFDGPAGSAFEVAIRERIGDVTVGGTTYQWAIPDTTPPAVVGTYPTDGATGVALDAPLVISFTEEIGPLSLNLLLTPTLAVTTAWNDAGTVFTMTHASFAGETTYTATVTANDAWGNPMAAPASWSFTTEKHRTYLPLILRDY